jgi:SAM-dependent methyltransferase
MSVHIVERIDVRDPDTAQHLKRQHLLRYRLAARMTQTGWLVGDLPCGTGYGSAVLAREGCRVLGIDRDAEAIAYAEEHYKQGKVDFVTGDLVEGHLSQNGVFDLIVCYEFIEHIAKAAAAIFMDRCATLLKSEGILLVSSPVKVVGEHSQINPYHINEMSVAELEQFVDEHGYDVVNRYGQAPLNQISDRVQSWLLSRGVMASFTSVQSTDLSADGRDSRSGSVAFGLARWLNRRMLAARWNCRLFRCRSSRQLNFFNIQLLVLKKRQTTSFK